MSEFWHITWVTHNSRVSQRMIEYNVKKDTGVWFDENIECSITKIICAIVKEYQYKVYAYNICKDHIHVLIDSEYDSLGDTVRTLKGLSSTRYKDILGMNRKVPYHLWAQKYNKWHIETDEQFRNTLLYIIYNREKHLLPENKGLKPLALSIVESCGNAEHISHYRDEVDRTYSAYSRDIVGKFGSLIENECTLLK